MVKLDGGRVLEHVSPDEVTLVRKPRVEGREELGFWGVQAGAHAWEFVVYESGVETGD